MEFPAERPDPSAPAVQRWLDATWRAHGTDLHLAVGAPPMVRVDGLLEALDGEPVLSADDVDAAISALAGPRSAVAGDAEIDFGFTWHDLARVRGNAYQERLGPTLALRLIPMAIPTIEELGLPGAIRPMLAAPSGLVVVTGPTGAGKSTTLAALIDAVNEARACHIVTIEDPIEYVHSKKRALVSQREVGADCVSFQSALRAVVRQDPDVVLVGEMRDLESIQTTLTLAETGHLVFTTLHTNDTAQALDRIVDVFPAERRPQIQVQLAATLQGVVYQRLVRRRDGGMVAAYELLVATHAVRNLVREGKSRQLRNVVATSQADGMQTLEMALSTLVAAGTVEHDTAVAASLHPAEVAPALPTPMAAATPA